MKVHVTLGEGIFISVESKKDAESLPSEIIEWLGITTKYFIDAIACAKMDGTIVSTAKDILDEAHFLPDSP